MYLGTKSDELYGRLFSIALIKGSFLSIFEKSVYMMGVLLFFLEFSIILVSFFFKNECKDTKKN